MASSMWAKRGCNAALFVVNGVSYYKAHSAAEKLNKRLEKAKELGYSSQDHLARQVSVAQFGERVSLGAQYAYTAVQLSSLAIRVAPTPFGMAGKAFEIAKPLISSSVVSVSVVGSVFANEAVKG